MTASYQKKKIVKNRQFWWDNFLFFYSLCFEWKPHQYASQRVCCRCICLYSFRRVWSVAVATLYDYSLLIGSVGSSVRDKRQFSTCLELLWIIHWFVNPLPKIVFVAEWMRDCRRWPLQFYKSEEKKKWIIFYHRERDIKSTDKMAHNHETEALHFNGKAATTTPAVNYAIFTFIQQQTKNIIKKPQSINLYETAGGRRVAFSYQETWADRFYLLIVSSAAIKSV